MKRDMDLVRQILIALNEHDSGYAPAQLTIDGYNQNEIKYHCLIMWEAGLIIADEDREISSLTPGATPIRLTWEGHDFLANASNEENWSEAKTALTKLGDVSFSIWGSVLSSIIKQNLGING